jgi:hypothetical protein
MPPAQIQPVRRHERRSIERDIPPALLRRGNPFQGMLHSSVVGLRGIDKEFAAGVWPVERLEERSLVHLHVGDDERHVREVRSLGAGVLPDADDRVVIVVGDHEMPVVPERIGFGN